MDPLFYNKMLAKGKPMFHVEHLVTLNFTYRTEITICIPWRIGKYM